MILSLRDEMLASLDCNRLRARNIRALEAPIHVASPKAYDVQIADSAKGFILTSQQAAYALPQTGQDRPVFTVGRASAASARARGFHNVFFGPSDGAALAEMVIAYQPQTPLCWLRATRISFDMTSALQKAGLPVDEAIVYEMQSKAALPKPALSALQKGMVTGIMALSKAQLHHLVDLLHHHDLWHLINQIDLFVVSDKVAEAASQDGWRSIITARRKRAISVQAAVICQARTAQ